MIRLATTTDGDPVFNYTYGEFLLCWSACLLPACLLASYAGGWLPPGWLVQG